VEKIKLEKVLTDKQLSSIFANLDEVLLESLSLLTDLVARQIAEPTVVTRIGDVLLPRVRIFITGKLHPDALN
jgi:hypothetical protein